MEEDIAEDGPQGEPEPPRSPGAVATPLKEPREEVVSRMGDGGRQDRP